MSTFARRILSFALLLLALSAHAQTNTDGVPRTYFGLHIHYADKGTVWPNVPFGSWRLWDAYVTWSDLEPSAGKWDFARLDRYVAMAAITKVDLLLPLANTPRWAAARPDEPSGYKPGNASEPANMDDWRRYVKTVGERYKGKVHNYEIWNEPNIKHHYSGSVEKLVEMTCEASRILKAIDPTNLVVSPAASSGAKGHVEYLAKFLALGGKQCIDVVAHHFYVPNGGPEGMVPMIRGVKAVMKNNGIADKPLWNTETGWWLANSDGTPDHPMVTKGWKKLGLASEAGDFVQRAFVLARAEGVDRFYWYAWDNAALGLINPKSKEPKPAAAAWRSLVDNMIGGTEPKCTQLGNAWTCTFASRSGSEQQINWVAE